MNWSTICCISCKSLRRPSFRAGSSDISTRSHIRESGALRSCGRPASSVRLVDSDRRSAASMTLNRSPSTRNSVGPVGSTGAGVPAASWSVACMRRVMGRVTCHENNTPTNIMTTNPMSQYTISELAKGGLSCSSGITSQSRSRVGTGSLS